MPPAEQVGELVSVCDLADVAGLVLDGVGQRLVAGLQVLGAAQFDILDQAREPEPSVGQLPGLCRCLLQVREPCSRVLGAEDAPGPVQGRRVGPDVLVPADVEGQRDEKLGPGGRIPCPGSR